MQVHSSDKPRLWNMTKDVVIACSLCGEYWEFAPHDMIYVLNVILCI